jgi:hypothetical protein
VALYFALRNRKDNESECAEVWGINAAALIGRARAVSREADKKVGSAEPGRIGTAYEQCQSPLQAAQWEDAHMEKLVRNALNPCRTRQKHYESNGFVGVTLPLPRIRDSQANRVCFSSMAQRTTLLKSR